MEKQIRCKDWLVCVEDVPESFYGWTLEDVEKEIMRHISIREADEEGCEIKRIATILKN